MNRYLRSIVVASALLAGATAAAPAQHPDDIWIGRTSSQQLAVGGFLEPSNVNTLVVLAASPFGWADNEPGFDRVVTPDATLDLNPLAAGALIHLEVVAIDPAFRIITPSFEVLDSPGEQTLLGDHLLHAHLTWNIDNTSPAFDPQQLYWNATLRLVDTGSTGYAPSAPFTLRFATRVVGDLDGDLRVDSSDLGALLASWGGGSGGDADGDGDTDESDLGLILGNWGYGT